MDGVSFAVHAGETVALVGESGCGKTSIAYALMRVMAPARAVGAQSRVIVRRRRLLTLDERAMRDIRGRKISMIFQEPASALNPVMKVGAQVPRSRCCTASGRKRAAWDRAVAMLDRTGIDGAPTRPRVSARTLGRACASAC